MPIAVAEPVNAIDAKQALLALKRKLGPADPDIDKLGHFLTFTQECDECKEKTKQVEELEDAHSEAESRAEDTHRYLEKFIDLRAYGGNAFDWECLAADIRQYLRESGA